MTSDRAIVLFGASGQIGSSLCRVWADNPVHCLPWRSDADFPQAELARLDAGRPTDLVFAGGLTNPALPTEELRRANVVVPQRGIELLATRPRWRAMTLGTIMETFAGIDANRYLQSKQAIGYWVAAEAVNQGLAARLRHVRLHTVYGGDDRRFLKRHMFLGQIVAALEANTPFAMTSGEQLREYHHTEDIARSLAALEGRDWTATADDVVAEISSGAPVRLVDLAKAIFHAFDADDLLRVGAVQRARGENLDMVRGASPSWLLPTSRDPIEGVIAWLRAIGVRRRVT